MSASVIPRRPVVSSQIASVGYDEGAKRLAIEFKSHNPDHTTGSVYEYENVEQDIADGFFREKDENGKKWSVGSHFGKTLKKDPKRWPYKKVSPAK
jgi:KTSC domain-containing protein